MSVISDYNLGKLYPDLIKKCHPTKNKKLTPYDIEKSQKNIWWKCKQGHEWDVRVTDRTSQGRTDFPICYHECKRSK